MKALERRIEALEGPGGFYSIGDMLDHLDGAPLPAGKLMHPALVQALDELPAADKRVDAG